MSNVDSRIVELRFITAQFEAGVKKTLDDLGKLKTSLKMDGASKGLDDVQKAASRFSFAGMREKAAELLDHLKLKGGTEGLANISTAVGKFSLGRISDQFASVKAAAGLPGGDQGIRNIQNAGGQFDLTPMVGQTRGVLAGFTALQVGAIAIVGSLAATIVNQFQDMVSQLTFSPATDGFREYETNLNSIQTILANTGRSGAQGLAEVTTALDKLNDYSDDTIYNFAEMATNIGRFTAAGVDLDTSVGAIKGIANLGAVSGSTSAQVSGAMLQISQALSEGRVSLETWNSIGYAGMGGQVFQTALIDTARTHGIAVDEMIEKNGSFRLSLQDGWLSADVLTETLAKFTGELTDEQLQQMGYTQEQIVGIQEMAATAVGAATEIKTMSQLFGALKETMGSGWAQSWRIIFGDFYDAKALFTGAFDALGGIIDRQTQARNALLQSWADMGGRTVLIEGIQNAWKALLDIAAPIREAFRQIFPAKTAEDLYNLTTRFRDFTAALIPGEQTVENLRRTFAGVFAVFSIIGQIIGGVVSLFGRLFSAVGDSAGGFLDFTGGIGDFLVNVDRMLEEGGYVNTFFETLGNILAVPLTLLRNMAGFIGSLFDGFDPATAEQIGDAVDSVTDRLNPLEGAGERIRNVFSRIGDWFTTFAGTLREKASGLIDSITDAFTTANFDRALDTINTGLFATLILMIRRFMTGDLINVDLGSGLFDSIKESFGAVTQTMQDMQANLKADTLLKIAAALGIMAGAIFLLSTIDSDKLATAMGGITIGFAGLQIGMTRLATAISFFGAAKIVPITIALVLLSIALIGIATALKIMATLDLGDTIQALIGMGGALVIISQAMKLMPKDMVGQAFALGILGASLIIIATAMKIFATIEYEELARGAASLAGSMTIIAGTMHLMPKNMAGQAAAMILLGIALNILAVALKVFATLSWDDMARGGAALAGSLLIIAGAMNLMPDNMLSLSVGLLAVSVAMNIIAGAMKIFATMSWEDIAQGLVAMGGAMLILAVGLNMMVGTLSGSAALLVAAGAIAILVPVLITLGNLDISTIVIGLAALAGIFLVLGVAGYVLGPLVPVILGLSVALVLIGAAMALVGIGALALAGAFATVVVLGAAGIQVLREALATFIAAIPGALSALAEGIVAFVQIIADNAPAFGEAFVGIMTAILNSIIETVPLMAQAFVTLVMTAVQVVLTLAPTLFAAGLQLILGFLQTVANNVGRIVDIATQIITEFVNGIARNLPSIVDSAFNLIISFMNSIGDAARDRGGELADAGWNMATGLVEGLVDGLSSLVGNAVDAAINLVSSAWDSAMDWLGINSPSKKFIYIGKWSAIGLAEGLDQYAPVAAQASENAGHDIVNAMGKTIAGLGDLIDGGLVDLNPVIAPVLDLSAVQRDASELGAMLAPAPLEVSDSYSKARDVTVGAAANRAAAAEAESSREGDIYNFNQTNNSPKALSTGEIYRDTKSLVARAKRRGDKDAD